MIITLPLEFFPLLKIYWKFSSNDLFLSKSAYHLSLNSYKVKESSYNPNWIWNVCTLSKIKHFIWLSFYDKIPHNYLLQKRLQHDPSCKFYGEEHEKTIYILKSCPVATDFWSNLLENAGQTTRDLIFNK